MNGERSSTTSKRTTSAKRSRKSTSTASAEASPARLALFRKYKDPGEARITPDGIEDLCRDLDINAEQEEYLVLAWKLGAASMGYFSEIEFVQGLAQCQCSTLDELRAHLPIWKDQRWSPDYSKKYYTWMFGFTKEPSQKSLDVAIATEILPSLLPDSPHTQPFVEYLRQHSQLRVINRDQWISFYEFSQTVPGDCSAYDPTAAWPTLLDEYVAWRLSRPA
ncbi:hypothetical protein H4R33_001777 [Dimargaris cristalligena]|nr:hypothetical protein H4R33_001777 [Dimargaris cristalligena]